MSGKPVVNPWLLARAVNQHARLNLICFPYAGGSAQLFNNWQTGLGTSEIQVYSVQYAGRGSRMREPAFTDCKALVDAFIPNLLPVLTKPFALFGHSMGSIIAFEVARRLQEKHELRPERLIVSARRAPQIPRTGRTTYNLPDAEFKEELRRLNGTPQEVLDHPELMELMLGIIRADFTLTQTYNYVPGAQLTCPISVYGGVKDTDIPRPQLEGWCEHTSAGCSIRMFEGNHFFILSDQAGVLRTVREQLLQ